MWESTDHGQFVEVVPLDDTRKHYLGDECWCNPKIDKDDLPRPLVMHNSNDKREVLERLFEDGDANNND